MKKISIVLLTALVVFNSSCLKDKNFEDQIVGIKNPGNAYPGVGFNLEGNVNFKRTVGFEISSSPQTLDPNAVTVGLYLGTAATKDVHVKVAYDPTILDDYNTQNGTSIQELDAALYTIATTDLVIPAGKQSVAISITIPSTVNISPDNTYGIGFKIISVDAGYTIAANMTKTLVEVVIKNQYDGEYTSNGYFYHPALPRAITERAKTMYTMTATSCAVELGDLASSGYFAILDVDPVTNDITIVDYPGSISTIDFGAGLPDTNPGYTAAWARSAECTNVYDPATKEFKVRYGYMGGTGYRVTEEVIQKN